MNWNSRFLMPIALISVSACPHEMIAAERRAPTAYEMRRNRFSHIIRMDLEDDHGQTTGKVKDFILSRRSGIVRFGIVVSGGTLGLGRSSKIVPAATLNSNTAKTTALGLSVSRFKLAEGFEFKRWELAALQQSARARQLDVIFGLARPNQTATPLSTNSVLEPVGLRPPPGSKNSIEEKLELASDLIGDVVVNRKQQKIGKVSDLLIDPSGHRSAVAIISTGHLLKHGKTYTIPIRRLGTVGNKQLSVDADLIAFASAPNFDFRAWEIGTISDTVCRYDDAEPDNTAKNLAIGNTDQPSALQQSESMADRRMTQEIRQEISIAPGLSFIARNIRIVTLSGKVTLSGPVVSAGEKERILIIARHVVGGTAAVNDELEVRK